MQLLMLMRRDMRTGRRAARGGFTIAELMVVVVIIGLMAGIVTLSWQRVLPKEQFISDVRALAERIHSCRSNAIAQNAELWMHYDLDKESYWITQPFKQGGGNAAFASEDATDSGMVEDEREWMERNKLFEHKLNKGIEIVSVTINDETFNDGPAFVPFTPIGTSSAHWIVLKQAATDSIYTLEIQGLTGLISFHEGLWGREKANDDDFN